MDNFPDLSHNSSASVGDESFWPSFTDIMMVVVMIFLISTASLIVKNWGLTQELTNTIESEKTARQAAEVTLAENLTLEERLAALEQILSVTQLSKMRTEEEKEALRKQLQQLTEDLARSTDISKTLEARLETKSNEIRELLKSLSTVEQELEQANSEVALKQEELKTAKASFTDEIQQARANFNEQLRQAQIDLSAAQSTITVLEDTQQSRQKEIAETKAQFDISEEQLDRLREEYTALESKYNKLVRPARTSKNKYVVSLRYVKSANTTSIELKTAEDSPFKAVSASEMHKQLEDLKQRYKDKLYIRIIFPEENQLSYQEAWSFTTDILNKYDYYHQGE